MYDEIFNPEDFENEGIDDSKDPIEVEFEFPTPKEGPSLDEMIRKYGLTIIEFSVKSIKHDYEVKEK
jgi:hypothetical protein